MLFYRPQSIWVNWFRNEILSGKVSYFRTIKEKQANKQTHKDWKLHVQCNSAKSRVWDRLSFLEWHLVTVGEAGKLLEEAIITALQSLKGKKSIKRLTFLSWQTTIYTLWTERNKRLHRREFKLVDSLLLQINSTVKNITSSLRQSQPSLASEILQLWFQGAPD